MMFQRNHNRVFVVDDEPLIASTTAMILSSSGFDAAFFTAPLEALQAAHVEAPDLLLSDVIMPILTGIELAIQIKAICPECKILLFSGQAATANLLRKDHENGHGFEILHKPLHPSDLLKKVQAALAPTSPTA
jgi:CheY-like chemotaxis protein